MALRTTEAEVKGICGTALTDEEITPFLCTASSLVDSLLTSLGYNDGELEKIELWLAAHFVSIRDPQVKSEQIGEANVSYHGNIITGTGLGATFYGQQVLMLEYRGKFASIMNSKGPASIRVVG